MQLRDQVELFLVKPYVQPMQFRSVGDDAHAIVSTDMALGRHDSLCHLEHPTMLMSDPQAKALVTVPTDAPQVRMDMLSARTRHADDFDVR